MLSIGVKINDLGWPRRAITHSLSKRVRTRASFGAHHENLNEDRLYWQRRRCSPMTLDSDNIRFMRIFAEVPWKGGVIQHWGNRKRVFSGFQTLHIRHLRKWGQHYYYLVPCRLSTDPKIRDLEWLWMAWMAILLHMFTNTNCHWLILVTYLLSFVYYT